MNIKMRVITTNRMLVINGIPIRTPCEIDIKSKQQFEYMKSYLRTECAEYEIIDETSSSKKPPNIISSQKVENLKIEDEVNSDDIVEIEDLEPMIEELNPDERILDKIMTS